MEASGAVAPSTTSGEVLVGSLIMMIEGEVVGLQEEDLGEEVMSRVRAMSTYDDEESLPTLPSRDSPNLLAEMVDVAEAHQEVFEKRISLASADDVAQMPSPTLTPQTPSRGMFGFTSDDVVSRAPIEEEHRCTSGLVALRVPARPKRPKLARDRSWALGFALCVGTGGAAPAYVLARRGPALSDWALGVATASAAVGVGGAVVAWASRRERVSDLARVPGRRRE